MGNEIADNVAGQCEATPEITGDRAMTRHQEYTTVTNMLALIDREIKKLATARDALLQLSNIRRPVRTNLRDSTRSQQITEALKGRPMSRRELQVQTGIPEGTMSWVLAKKELFELGSDGKWRLRSDDVISGTPLAHENESDNVTL